MGSSPWKGKPFWSRWVCFLRVLHVFGLDTVWLTHQPNEWNLSHLRPDVQHYIPVCNTFGSSQPGQCARGSDRYPSACECLGFEDYHNVNTCIHTDAKKTPNSEQSCLSWRSDAFSYLFSYPHPQSPFLFPSCTMVLERQPKWQFIWTTRLKGFHFTSHK